MGLPALACEFCLQRCADHQQPRKQRSLAYQTATKDVAGGLAKRTSVCGVLFFGNTNRRMMESYWILKSCACAQRARARPQQGRAPERQDVPGTCAAGAHCYTQSLASHNLRWLQCRVTVAKQGMQESRMPDQEQKPMKCKCPGSG